MDQQTDQKALLAFDAIEDEPSHSTINAQKGSQRSKQHWLFYFSGRGSRWAVGACATTASIVLFINFITTISLAATKGFAGGSSTIYQGDCTKVRKYNTVAHFFINVFSTILLRSSNYCMQCLSAPTRREVDNAHRKGKVLDIGIPSVRNLFAIRSWRTIFWVILCFSSVPLHLFYNSAIYTSLGTNDYTVMSVNEAFLGQENANLTDLRTGGFAMQYGDFTKVGERMRSLETAGQLQHLDVQSCIKAYAVDYISARRNLLLVVPIGFEDSVDSRILGVSVVDNSAMDEALSSGCDPDPYSWICGDFSQCHNPCNTHNISSILDNYDEFKVHGAPVDHCLSEVVPERCNLNLDLTLIVIVMFANLFKAILMTVLAFWLMEAPLLNLGDAISTFLHKQDLMTEGACLASKAQFDAGLDYKYGNTPDSREWRSRALRWYSTVGGFHWFVFLLLYGAAIGVCIFLLGYGLNNLRGGGSTSDIWSYGIGAIHTETLIYWKLPSTGAKGLIENILVANSPQVVLSFIYFTFNAILTRMLAGREWTEFAHIRKALRVSSRAKGLQRTTYFLQVPYRYGIPLLSISALFHWLVSQSIFLVAVTRYDPLGNQPSAVIANNISMVDQAPEPKGYLECGSESGICMLTPTHLTCSWSPVAVVCVILLAALALTYCAALAFRRYRPGMPLAGSSSAVIAAACHPIDERTKMEVGARVQWGVQRRPRRATPGHCSFSAEPVEFPEDGAHYK